MPRRKLEDRNIRKLTRVSGGESFGVTIPIEWVRKLGWREKQKLNLRLHGKKVVVEDWEKG